MQEQIQKASYNYSIKILNRKKLLIIGLFRSTYE